jgi:hypothetical protein
VPHRRPRLLLVGAANETRIRVEIFDSRALNRSCIQFSSPRRRNTSQLAWYHRVPGLLGFPPWSFQGAGETAVRSSKSFCSGVRSGQRNALYVWGLPLCNSIAQGAVRREVPRTPVRPSNGSPLASSAPRLGTPSAALPTLPALSEGASGGFRLPVQVTEPLRESGAGRIERCRAHRAVQGASSGAGRIERCRDALNGALSKRTAR